MPQRVKAMERIPEEEAIAELADVRRYNKIMGRGFVRREYRKIARMLRSFGLPAGCRVLDVGTGTGYVALETADAFDGKCCVVGLDISSAMLSVAEENARSRGLEASVAWEKGQAAAMPFDDGEFDAAVSSGSLHHWEDPIRVFDEISRVMKPEGRLIVRDFRRPSHWGFPSLLATAIGLTLPSDFRGHYWGSIRSSYTAKEIGGMLERSGLSGSRVFEDMLDVTIIR